METHDAVNLVGDPVGDLAEDSGREVEPVGSHEVLRLDRPQADNLLVSPPVTLNTNRLDRQQRRERLSDLVVETGLADLLDEDLVGVLGDLDLLAGDGTEDTDGESRSGEGVTADEVSGDVEETTEGADFVLEELTKGLDELELHVVEETTDVVVRLDRCRGTLERDRLDDIRVQSSLEEELDLAVVAASGLDLSVDLSSLRLEDLDEGVADDLALLLGVLNASELVEEKVGSVDDGKVHAKVLAEHLVDLSGLVHTKAAVVDHDGVEATEAKLLSSRNEEGRIEEKRRTGHR
jgi:hypothetical protein